MRPEGGGNLHPADAGGAIAEEWFYVDFGAGAEKGSHLRKAGLSDLKSYGHRYPDALFLRSRDDRQ